MHVQICNVHCLRYGLTSLLIETEQQELINAILAPLPPRTNNDHFNSVSSYNLYLRFPTPTLNCLLRVARAQQRDTPHNPHASESRTFTLDAVRANPTPQTHYSVTHPPWGRLAPDQDCCCEAAYRQGREVVTLKHPVYSLQNLRRRFLPADQCCHFDVHRLGHFGEAKTPFGGC